MGSLPSANGVGIGILAKQKQVLPLRAAQGQDDELFLLCDLRKEELQIAAFEDDLREQECEERIENRIEDHGVVGHGGA